jgi:hypothetical protein
MHSCASAAKLRGGGPILHNGMKAMVFAGPRHLEPSSATRHHSADRAETVRRLANWSTGRVFQAGRMTTPSGITPSRTSRHRAISSLQARAAIMVLRAFGAFSVRWRYHCASALSFWNNRNRHASWTNFSLTWSRRKQDQRVETATAFPAVPNMTGALIAPVLGPFGGDQLITALNAFHPEVGTRVGTSHPHVCLHAFAFA